MNNPVDILLAGLGPLLFGLGLLWALRIVSDPADNAETQAAFLVTLVARIALVVGGVVVLLSGVGLILGAAILILGGFVVCEVRRSRRRMLLEILAAATERNLPLVDAVEAFADERFGWPSWKARRLAALLRGGCSLGDALDRVRGLLSPEARMQIHLGEALGALAPALREAIGPPSWEELVWRRLAGKILYVAAVLLFFCLVALFLFLKIIPCYQRIFLDWDTELPNLTRWLVEQAYVMDVVGVGALLFWIGLAIALLAVYTLLRTMGIVRWNLPGMDRLLRGRHAATILEAMALATRGERPLLQTIELLAGHYPRSWVRKRLARVCRDVQAGGMWCESLCAHGLITQAEAAILLAAQRVGNLSWALREMAAGSRRRLAYRVQAGMQVGFPLAIVLIGVAVLTFILGIYLPMIELIRFTMALS